jgi:hypothetical protein
MDSPDFDCYWAHDDRKQERINTIFEKLDLMEAPPVKKTVAPQERLEIIIVRQDDKLDNALIVFPTVVRETPYLDELTESGQIMNSY